jgi:hypothetical protein
MEANKSIQWLHLFSLPLGLLNVEAFYDVFHIGAADD